MDMVRAHRPLGLMKLKCHTHFAWMAQGCHAMTQRTAQ